ncbi:hypothetical protein NPIL_97891 [Nephila pilipes]|uniref:Uncharacterized protein n=1 Tax=Nephila pilipes TaxID=299642 RepID=A0A8X6TSV7_NEPPI|nr:hypothetical protein NPIL_97891 [Nephila pilipes]
MSKIRSKLAYACKARDSGKHRHRFIIGCKDIPTIARYSKIGSYLEKTVALVEELFDILIVSVESNNNFRVYLIVRFQDAILNEY